LKRSKAVGVGATPGFTKTVQEIHLDKQIKLLDCPGIVFGDSTSDSDIILRNCVKIEKIVDPIEPVEAILKRCSRDQLLQLYRIPTFTTCNEFLIHIAQKKGRLAKGGRADLEAAARTVLQDWNGGKISFYTTPPTVKNVHVSSAIVSTWGKEFDLDDLIEQEKDSVLNKMPSMMDITSLQSLAMEPGEASMADKDLFEDNVEEMEPVEEDVDEEEEEEEEEEETGPVTFMSDIPHPVVVEEKPKKLSQKLKDLEDIFNPQVNKNKKKEMKKIKKLKQKKQDSMDDDTPSIPAKSTSKIVDDDDDDDAYDFDADFTFDQEVDGSLRVDDDDIDLDDI